MQLMTDAFKVVAWVLLRDAVRSRGLSEEWLRQELGTDLGPLDTWLRSPDKLSVGDYCELILAAEGMPPARGAEPPLDGYEVLFQDLGLRRGSIFPAGGATAVAETTDESHPRRMLLELAFWSVLEDVRAGRRTSQEVAATLHAYSGLLEEAKRAPR